MFYQMTLLGSPSATSSPESESGHTHSGEPGGQTIGQSGPAVVPVNLSARQAKEQGLLTSVTSGQLSIGSLASDSLQSALVSRLAAALANTGSTMFSLTWNHRTTPAGRPHSRLAASVRRISDSECIGWPTPMAGDMSGATHNGRSKKTNLKLRGAALLTAWPTPMANDATGSGYCYGPKPANPMEEREIFLKLPGAARLTASGELLTGSTAQMESGGRLNPALSRWLMGLPPEWDDCAALAMPSSRRKQKNSSDA